MSATGFMPDEAAIAGIKKDLAAYEAERDTIRRKAMWRVPLHLGGMITNE